MSRTSGDQYKLSNGNIVTISTMNRPPVGATLWNGYDYTNQFWVRNGSRDTRTLEELRADIAARKEAVCHA